MPISIDRARFRKLSTMVLIAGVLPLVSCNKDRILDIIDPDLVNPSNLASAAAAEARRVGALSRLNDATSGLAPPRNTSLDEGVFFHGGLVSDELRSGDTFIQRDQPDQRSIQITNAAMTVVARGLNRVRVSAIQAIPVIQQYLPAQLSSVGQMYWLRGYAENMLAESFCNGTPISALDAASNITYGKPETNAEVYARAIASFLLREPYATL